MARERDESKRAAIMAEAKRLFSERGFHATSVQDIVRAIGLPVGSVYTYFQNKEEILKAVIDEGWDEFFSELSRDCAAEPSPLARLGLIVRRYLPRLLADADFLSIILTEGFRQSDVGEKLERVSALVGAAVNELAQERGTALRLSPKQAASALAVFFLGGMDAVRLARHGSLPLSEGDLIGFIELVIESSFGVRLPPVEGPPAD